MQGCERKLLEKEKPYLEKKKLKFEIIIILILLLHPKFHLTMFITFGKTQKKIEN
jgi:hypothetical protein